MRSPDEDGVLGLETFCSGEVTGASATSSFGGVGEEVALGAGVGAASDVEGV